MSILSIPIMLIGINGGYFSAICRYVCLPDPDFLESTSSITSVTSAALQLQFVFVTSFLLLGQLRDLPHSKNDF